MTQFTDIQLCILYSALGQEYEDVDGPEEIKDEIFKMLQEVEKELINRGTDIDTLYFNNLINH